MLLGAIICIISLIIRAIKRKPIKHIAIWTLVCIVLFTVGGSSMSSSDSEKSNKTNATRATQNQSKQEETTASKETKSDGYSLIFGELLNANPNGGVDGKTLVIKAKINSQLTNNMTISQNYHNVEDIIKNQGGDKFNCIDYWAVADMNDGSEQKVVAFTVNSTMIKNVANGNIVATQFGDYVDDLFIHQSLK